LVITGFTGCAARGNWTRCPRSAPLLAEYDLTAHRGSYNMDARRCAGFTEAELQWLQQSKSEHAAGDGLAINRSGSLSAWRVQ
jgi:hypothetical protein